MAVQKTKKSRSRTGMKRSHHALKMPTLTVDVDSGETHRRHHITPSGVYRGRQVLPLPPEPVGDDNPRGE